MRILIPTLFAALVMALIWVFDLPKTLGAHPWWSAHSVLIGAPSGIILALIAARLPITPLIRLALFALATIAAYAIATSGGAQFAASYAEDAFAGRLWYVGWIATMAALAASLTTLAQTRR